MAGRILIADDTEYVRKLFKRFLEPLADEILEAESGAGLRELALAQRPDLILLDVNMPGPDVLETVELLRDEEALRTVPLILISGASDADVLDEAFKLGADDFMLKPPNFRQLKARVLAYLADGELRRVKEQARQERASTFSNIAKLIESREPDMDRHPERIRAFTKVLGQKLSKERPERGLDHDFVDAVAVTSPLYDIGKSAIPDAVLLKPAPLDEHETAVMRGHAEKGAEMIAHLESSHNRALIRVAVESARAHHERWDGSGYPRGLVGEEIPQSARLLSLCDVYEALRSARPRRPALSHQEAAEIVMSGKGSQFEPAVVEAFREVQDKFAEIRERSPG